MFDQFNPTGIFRLLSDSTGSDNTPYRREDVEQSDIPTKKIAIGIIVGMFLVGFASIPLYRMVCGKLDPGGSSAYNGDPDVYEDVEVDEDRTVEVHFSTNVERQLPWEFNVEDSSVEIHPGEQNTVQFSAHNFGREDATGKAVYDISPPEAAPHFKKLECFCFTQQTLPAGRQLDFPLVYWLDPELPDHIDQVYLGYTFFNAATSRARAEAQNTQ